MKKRANHSWLHTVEHLIEEPSKPEATAEKPLAEPKKKALIGYIFGLLCLAFMLVLISFLIDSHQQMQQFNQTAQGALQHVEIIQEENRIILEKNQALQEEIDNLQEKNLLLQVQVEALQQPSDSYVLLTEANDALESQDIVMFTDCMTSLEDLHTTLQPAGEQLYQFLLSKQEALSK